MVKWQLVYQDHIARLMVKPSYPWLVWGLAALFFFIDYFARVAPAVMVDQLMRDFHVLGFMLGCLSAFFYYTYVAMQMPVGMLVDRFSVRWLLTWMCVLSAIGCALFASATHIETAAIGRLVLGFGASFAFISALKLAATWFSPTRFGLLAGLTQAIGMFGAAVGQAPMAYSVGVLGWRPTLWLIVVLLMMLAVAMALWIRDKPPSGADPEPVNAKLSHSKHMLSGLYQVLCNPQTWWNALLAGLLFAPTAALAELWGVKFFRQTYDLSNTHAAIGVGMIFLGWTIGGPLIGWFSDHIKRRRPLLIWSAILCLILLLFILYCPGLPVVVLFSLLFLYGIANTGVAIAYTVSSEINPRPLAGTSMAFANMASVLIGASFQPLIGWLLDRSWDGKMINQVPIYTSADFRIAMIVLPVCLALAVLVALRVRETHCQIVE